MHNKLAVGKCDPVTINADILITPPRNRGGGEVLQSACLCVCLSTSISRKRHGQALRNFIYKFNIASPSEVRKPNAMCYLLPVFWHSPTGYVLHLCIVINAIVLFFRIVAWGDNQWRPWLTVRVRSLKENRLELYQHWSRQICSAWRAKYCMHSPKGQKVKGGDYRVIKCAASRGLHVDTTAQVFKFLVAPLACCEARLK